LPLLLELALSAQLRPPHLLAQLAVAQFSPLAAQLLPQLQPRALQRAVQRRWARLAVGSQQTPSQRRAHDCARTVFLKIAFCLSSIFIKLNI
jgi:hypothetical protein